ncbi:MAG: copper chaperone PCu(A)C [Zoogloeaceae bacterium]|jgi:copper(I)-binding protein|nr:copper chaperone PCu(A)C [Zoogloeaceae bacterium]
MRVFCFFLTFFCCFSAAQAETPLVRATDAWVRATVPGQSATGAFMTLYSDAPMKLVEVRSPLAAVTEIHEMRVDENGVMRMRAISQLDLPAQKATPLKPGGRHIMLQALKKEARAGERTTLTLVLEDAEGHRHEIAADAEIRPLNAPH